MIRGISDYADANKSELEKQSKDGWRKYAAGNAARILAEIVRAFPIKPMSPEYNLDLRADREPHLLIDRHLFLHKKGARNFSFSHLLKRTAPTLKLSFAASGRNASGASIAPERALCIVATEDWECTIKPSWNPEKGILTFAIPPSEGETTVKLLLAFANPVDRVDVTCSDIFGRKVSDSWTKGKMYVE
jgi:hypothetical protein